MNLETKKNVKKSQQKPKTIVDIVDENRAKYEQYSEEKELALALSYEEVAQIVSGVFSFKKHLPTNLQYTKEGIVLTFTKSAE